MSRLWYALWPAAVVLGLGVEWAAFDDGELGLVVADLLVGLLLIGCGLVAWRRRPESRVGLLMGIAGVTWFAGNLGQAALYLHRGPLVHLHLSYPTGRLPTRLSRVVVIAAYVDAVVEPIARNDPLTLALAALVALASVQIFLQTSGPARKAGVPALVAALAFAAVLALGAAMRLAGLEADNAVLWAYDIVIAAIAVTLLVDLLRGRWSEAVVAGLVVDLGRGADVGTLQDTLGRALGDRSLVLGYWLPEEARYVDDAGRPLELPEPGGGRAVTPIAHDGKPVGVLVRDAAALDDPGLVEAVAAAARLAVSNARLQAEVRARVVELAASRRRLVEAADEQRRQLERELRDGAERRLAAVADLLAEARNDAGTPVAPQLGDVEGELSRARSELRDFARGIHPRTLTDAGLPGALRELAARAGIPVETAVSVGRLAPAVEAAVYFVCSEALANVAKYAKATRVTIDVATANGHVVATIADDGVGGADSRGGSGLRGLADRVEALGGRLRVESPPGAGTTIEAVLPAAVSPGA
jgi:signal transduction histidine kinase